MGCKPAKANKIRSTKSEIRNPKQYRMFKIQILKTKTPQWMRQCFEFVSDFDIRVYNDEVFA